MFVCVAVLVSCISEFWVEPVGFSGVLGCSGLFWSVGSVIPVAGISTEGFAKPHTVHSSCFSPGFVSVASRSMTQEKECDA